MVGRTVVVEEVECSKVTGEVEIDSVDFFICVVCVVSAVLSDVPLFVLLLVKSSVIFGDGGE